MEVKIKKLYEDAMLPTYATDGSGCFDLYMYGHKEDGTLLTGLAFEIPQDHVMLVFSRSGHGFKQNVRLANCVGVIDSDYRGEVCVKLVKDNPNFTDFRLIPGDRVAQAMIIPIPKVQFLVVDKLSDTERGSGGFGSTNK
jgi:dUTP pyrophosphatase